MKVKQLLMIAAMLFAIIPIVAYTAIAVNFMDKNGVQEFETEVTSMAANQASALSTLVSTAKSDIEILANMQAVKGAGTSGSGNSSANDLLEQFASSNAGVMAARLIDGNGKVIAGTGAGETVENFNGYSGYGDNTLYFDEPSGKLTNNAALFIKKAIGKSVLMVSYCASGDDSVVAKICDNSKFYNEGSVIVVDSKGCWSTGSGFTKDFASQVPEAAGLFGTLSEGTASPAFNYVEKADKSINNLASVVKAGGDNGLYALVSCPDTNAANFARGVDTPLIVVTIILIVLSVVFAIIASNVTTAPLKKIEKTLETIRNGDHEARIGTMANNEYGQLSRAFNNLVDEIVVSEDRYRNISEMSDNIIFEWNFKTNEVVFSNNFNKKFSYRAPSNHFGDSFLLKAKIHPDDVDKYRHDLDQLEKGNNFERNEYRIKNIYGDFIWVLMRTATLRDSDGKPVKVVGVMVDIDRGKKSEQQLTERASYDALTELYNRETIESQIDNEISLSEMRKSELAVLFVDVDDFKHYNDNYSHATGDQVLKFLAKTIKEAVDGIGFAGRYGGDEFIIMVRNAEENDPALLAQKIITNLSKGFDADVGERLTVSVSIGIALIKDDYNTRVEYLIGKADDAMYSVKKSGKSNYAFI